MIEEYLKKLEKIISPQTYDLENYKDKILQSNIDIPDKDFVQGLEDFNDLECQSESKKEIKDKRQVDKIIMKSYGNDKSQSNLVADPEKLRQRVHNLNVKNMAYRQQIDALNRKIEDQGRTIETQRRTIEENMVTIENNSRYLLKLESYLVEAGKNKARERFTLNLLGVNCGFANECKDQASKATFSVEKSNMREMIIALTNENQKLKSFQNKIIDLSQTYDEINQNMLESLKEAQDSLNGFFNNKEINDNTAFYLDEINQNIKKIVFCLDETLTTKQEEYKLILENREHELEFLRKEIVELNERLENAKKDRMKDQKTMIEIECQNDHLHQEIEELNRTIHENFTKLKLLDSENISSKIEVSIKFF